MGNLNHVEKQLQEMVQKYNTNPIDWDKLMQDSLAKFQQEIQTNLFPQPQGVNVNFEIQTGYGNFSFVGDPADPPTLDSAKTEVKRQLGMERLPKGYKIVVGGQVVPSLSSAAVTGTDPAPPTASPTKSEEWDLATKIMPVARRIFICGPPGISKTYFANNYCLDTPNNGKRTVYNVTMHEESDPSMLMGHYVLNENGGMKFRYGYGAEAMVTPHARLVINEITRASGPTLSMCYALLDDPENNRVTLDNGETITPAEGFQIICTDNGTVKDLPPALEDRFEVILEVTQPHPDAIAILSKDIQNAARGTIGHPNPEQMVGLRKWITFDRLRTQLDPETAARAVFGGRWKDVLQSIKLSS